MRVAYLAALCLLVVIPFPARADDKDDRKVWVYEGGWFSTKDNKTWIELSDGIYDGNEGKPFEFKEVKRTKEYVEIHDESRGISVRLREKQMEWQADDDKDTWTPLHKGKWKKQDESD